MLVKKFTIEFVTRFESHIVDFYYMLMILKKKLFHRQINITQWIAKIRHFDFLVTRSLKSLVILVPPMY